MAEGCWDRLGSKRDHLPRKPLALLHGESAPAPLLVSSGQGPLKLGTLTASGPSEPLLS